MASGSIDFTVDQPPERAFAYIADLENAPHWVPDLVSMTKVTPGEIRIGTQYSEVVRMGKQTNTAELEVTAFDPPNLFAHSGDAGSSQFTGRFEFFPEGAGTRVVHTWTVQFKGIARLFAPFITGWVKKNTSRGIAQLQKNLSENE